MKDYRWKAGDTVSLYRLQQSTDGTLVWDWDENRTLKGAVMTTLGSAAAALTLALATQFAF